MDTLLHNISNGKTDESIYSIRILINLCYNSDIKARIYERVAIPLSSLVFSKPDSVVQQILMLFKKCVDGEQTDLNIDARLIECLVHCCKHEQKQVFEQGFSVLRHMISNEKQKGTDVLL